MDANIAIKVKSEYLADQSHEEQDRYVFSYTITITNNGNQSAQLISRHWIITDESGETQEVKGLGVIGQQPIILPGDSYTYSSGAVLTTSTGTMEGCYQMKSEDETLFDTPIPTFALIPPSKLH